MASRILRSGSDYEFWNFVGMAVLFSANHGCVVACLSLATARLGNVGAWQSGILYFTYALSGLIGSTAIVKVLKPRNALVAGMGLYCGYVAAFYFATVFPAIQDITAAMGALTGGVGAGFLWTAQGAYFAAASRNLKIALREEEEQNESLGEGNDNDASIPNTSDDDDPSNRLAGVFAFIYLSTEVLLRSLSSLLLHVMNWTGIFAFYSMVAVISTFGMATCIKIVENQSDPEQSLFFKATAAYRLLRDDRKMKFLIPTTALFGWASAFLSSYVNGQVVHVVLKEDNAIGWLTAWVSCVAAVASLFFGRISGHKESILAFGALCFSSIALVFVLAPQTQSRLTLFLVYTFHGLGRATFEGTLRSAFAELFDDKEGAFANIILQNGTITAIGFLLSFHLQCTSTTNPYCIEYRDGSRHDILIYEILILVTATMSIIGYRQAMRIHDEAQSEERAPLVENVIADHEQREINHAEEQSTDVSSEPVRKDSQCQQQRRNICCMNSSVSPRQS